ncbi:MAG: hemerythrin domain-containing protein [bacterium]|nr:hemerythrin domain-containing protein [bacterium]
MKSRLIGEHRRIESLIEALERGFASCEPCAQLWESFGQFCEELQAHIEREDRLYFPAITALRPDLKAPLEELTAVHVSLSDQLRRIGDHLGHDDEQGAADVFRSLSQAFHTHEDAEEQILAGLDAELEG